MKNQFYYQIYKKLLKAYGPQGWWPLLHLPQKYHCGQFDLPKTRNELFEIYLGAILTQNTTWRQAEIALNNLFPLTGFAPENLLALDENRLKEAIIPARYANQKSNYLQTAARFFIDLKERAPSRTEILKVKGIGNETADCILLYAYHQLEFVIDAYTYRIFSHLGLNDTHNYLTMKQLFEDNLPQHVPLYQEYHALIVRHGSLHYSKRPYGKKDSTLGFYRRSFK
ncbi:endonuclease III domain-containing protein [Deltaproteobacteria bacterium TL4]